MTQVVQHDVVIIGGGGAGLRAAAAVVERAPSLSVAIVSKVYPMRSHTVAAEGGAAAVIAEGDDFEGHITDTIRGSEWLADQDAVEAFVHEAPAELTRLERLGCPWSRRDGGDVAVRPFGGMKRERTWYAADKTGFHMLHTLFQSTLKHTPITRYDEHMALRLIVDDGRCCGLAALDLASGEVRAIGANATIITTGGAGCVYAFTTNAAIKTGDGMALAHQAGAGLKDMEFVQYHPTALAATGILITEAARGEGAVLLNREGRRYLQDYDLGEPLDVSDPAHPTKGAMELGPRDRLCHAFYHEMQAGRTFQAGREGSAHAVHLDLRHLGQKRIDYRLPFVRELARDYGGVDPVHEPIPVRPAVHYTMGGIDTDMHGATTVEGLYAAGECACVSINGANRLGSNSLTELLVFGARAGHAAAERSQQTPPPDQRLLAEAGDAEDAHLRRRLLSGEGSERIVTIRTELRHAMETGCGIFRDGERIARTCATLAELRQRYQQVRLDDTSGVFNTELMHAIELGCMLEVAEAIAHAAAARHESRGSHQRLDYPQRDDAAWLKHSVAHHQPDGPPRIEHRDVTITRWPPGERSYRGDGGEGKKQR